MTCGCGNSIKQVAAKATLCFMLSFVAGALFLSPAVAQEQIKFSGYVKDASGRPSPDAIVHISGPLFVDVVRAETRTDSQGYYQLYIGKQRSYSILIVPAKKKEARGYTYMYELPIVRHVERAGRTDIREDFTLQRAGNIVLHGYLSDGSIARFGHFKAIPVTGIREILYATDARGIPIKSSSDFPVFDDYAIAQGWSFDAAIPSIIVPLNTPTVINVLWEVPGFGQVMLKADNGGAGYVTTPQNDLLTLNLNYELARTAYRTVKEALAAYSTADYAFSRDIQDMIARAKGHLDKAAQAAGAERAAFADLSLNQSLWAAEQLELEKAAQAIERFRKVDITLQVRDEMGDPIVGTDVSYNQTEHSFQFAMMEEWQYNPRAAQVMRAAGFNLAWLQFYAASPAKSQYDWAFLTGTGVEEYRELGYTLAVEGLIALELGAHPAWWDDLGSFEELDRAIYEHVRTIVGHYKDEVDLWIVSHEPHIKVTYAKPYKFYFTREQAVKAIKTAIKGVREVDPTASTAVMVGFGVDGSFLSEDEGDEITSLPREFLKLLNREGVDYDFAEIQFNYGAYSPGVPGTRFAFMNTRDLASIADLLDAYAALGKPIGIQIFNAPSEPYPEQYGYWHRQWDEELQAERVVSFFTIAFGNRHVNKITYWSVMDKEGSSVGLVRRDGSPKPAYYALKELITQKWMTRGQATTDIDGRISFRGFAGTYTISVLGYEPQEIAVTEAGPNDFTLQLKALDRPVVDPPTASAVFTLSSLSISPAEVNIGEMVTISVSVANTGDLAGSYEVIFRIDDVVIATKDVTLDGGASQKVTFTTTKNVAGTYAISVNGLTGSFVVKKAVAVPPSPSKEIDWALTGGIIGGLVAMGLLIFLLRRRRVA